MPVGYMRITASATFILTDIGKHWLPCFGLSVTAPTSVSSQSFDDRAVFSLYSFCCGCSGCSCHHAFSISGECHILHILFVDRTIRRRCLLQSHSKHYLLLLFCFHMKYACCLWLSISLTHFIQPMSPYLMFTTFQRMFDSLVESHLS